MSDKLDDMPGDEMLMAYADGELDAAGRLRVEEAMRADPAVAAAVERHRALRADVFAAFAGVLDEPVPQRLQAAVGGEVQAELRTDARTDVRTDASPVRTDVLAAAGARALPPRWRGFGALAASLAVGVLVGALWRQGGGGDAAPFARAGGAVVAQGELAQALSSQLAAAPDGGAVRIGVSFVARDGSYCRSFQMGTTGGLACRAGDQWRIPVMAEGGDGGGSYRQAGSGAPPAVLDAIDARIAGAALDAGAERAARDRGWRR